jgi:hypothetical protein
MNIIEESLPIVLVVEDDPSYHRDYVKALEGKAQILSAFTLEEGQQQFRENFNRISVIVLDACVPGDWPTTPPLSREFRQAGFKGPMVAASSIHQYRRQLMEAGCDIDSNGKGNVPRIVTEFLAKNDLLPKPPG